MVDPHFPDTSLGGWSGTIIDLDSSNRSPFFRVEWDQVTVERMSLLYRDRCAQDCVGFETVWMMESDLEADSGDPAIVEPPIRYNVRPLYPLDVDDRIRAIFGLTSEDPLPDVNEETLRTFHGALKPKLSISFRAKVEMEPGEYLSVRVLELLPPEEATLHEGLLCRGVTGDGDEIVLPLSDLERVTGRGRMMIEDYQSWLWDPTDLPLVEVTGNDVQGDPPPLSSKQLCLIFAALCCVGGLFGATIGTTLSCFDSGDLAVKATATVVGLQGALLAFFIRKFNPSKRTVANGYLSWCALGGGAGALLGALAAAIALTLTSSIAGGVLGYLAGLLPRRARRSLGHPWQFAVFGLMAGSILQGWQFDPEHAWLGVWQGGFIGAVVFPAVIYGLTLILALEERVQD